MNTSIMAFAFILMFNPTVHVIDILPDFIGWWLLYFSLRRVRHLCVQADNAASSASKMAWLTFAGFVCVFLIPSIDGTMMLTLTFVLNVMKLIWGIPAFKYLFDGLCELSGLYDGKNIYEPIGRSKKEGVQSAYKTTLVFFISSCVISTLPEFAELSGHSSLILSEGQRTLLSFKPLFYTLSVTVSLILGIVWLTVIIPFVKKIGKDTEFIANLREGYRIKVIDTGKHRVLTLMSAFFMAAISGLFVLSITFDRMDVVPRFILPIIMLCVSVKVGLCGYKTKLLTSICAVTSAVSLASYVMRWVFILSYSLESVKILPQAQNFYNATISVICAELCLLIIQQIIWARLLIKIINNDTLIIPAAVGEDAIREQTVAAMKHEKRRVGYLTFFFITANVLSFVFGTLPSNWMIALIFGVIYFAYSYSLYTSLRENTERKYL